MPLVLLASGALFVACSVRSEHPPPQAPGPTIINNTPPSDNGGFFVLITVLVIGALLTVWLLARNQGRAESEARRAQAAEAALNHVLARHPNALAQLNGQYMYPPSAAQMPVPQPQVPMLERGPQ